MDHGRKLKHFKEEASRPWTDPTLEFPSFHVPVFISEVKDKTETGFPRIPSYLNQSEHTNQYFGQHVPFISPSPAGFFSLFFL